MITPHDTAIVGAFFMEGMRDVGDYDDLIIRWARGCYELVYEVTRYAEYCWKLAEAGGAVTGEFYGVYDYDVSSPFGTWFAKTILETGEPPTRSQCRIWLLNAAEAFFMQGETEEIREELSKALIGVEFAE